MREAVEILRQSNSYASATYERANKAWDLTLREHDITEDMWNHRRSEIDTLESRRMVDELNRREGRVAGAWCL